MTVHSRVGEQLVLSLDDVRLQRVVEPWDGRSPRVLTAAYERFTLKAQAAKKRERFASCGQLELWPTEEEGPPVYRGAPLLLPLKEVRHG